MGFPNQKKEEAPEQVFAPAAEQQPELLDEKSLFPRKPLPYREVEFAGADGKNGKVLVQALTSREMDEINHVQNQPIKDAHGRVLEEANQMGWDAKVIARAIRRPDRTRIAGEHWLATSVEIETQWLPGTIKAVRNEILELSGYGLAARAEQKKG